MIASPFPEEIGFSCCSTEEARRYKLDPEEESLLQAASNELYRSQFRAGRIAARHALEQIGMIGPVLRGSRREPLFPDGSVGSITHSAEYSIAAAASCSAYLGIGIDLELRDRQLTHDISEVVCHKRERSWCEEKSDEKTLRSLMIFSSKEALFKAVYQLYGSFFGFQEAHLVWNKKSSHFVAELLFQLPADLAHVKNLEVYCELSEQYIFSWCLVSHQGR